MNIEKRFKTMDGESFRLDFEFLSFSGEYRAFAYRENGGSYFPFNEYRHKDKTQCERIFTAWKNGTKADLTKVDFPEAKKNQQTDTETHNPTHGRGC